MKFLPISLGFNLDDYVHSILAEWQPDGVDLPDYPESPAPTLHDLFDVDPDSSSGEASSESLVSSTTSVPSLDTPPTSPVPLPPSPATITEDMLLCLESLPTFDDNDEVRNEDTAFCRWEENLDPAEGPVFGCLRCAFYQSRGESSICGLCYLKALSEGEFALVFTFSCHSVLLLVYNILVFIAVPFAFPERSEPPRAAPAASVHEEVIFVSATKRPCSTSASESSTGAKRQCLQNTTPEEQTEPLDLSTKPHL